MSIITTALVGLGPVVFSIHLCIIKNLIGRCCMRTLHETTLFIPKQGVSQVPQLYSTVQL